MASEVDRQPGENGFIFSPAHECFRSIAEGMVVEEFNREVLRHALSWEAEHVEPSFGPNRSPGEPSPRFQIELNNWRARVLECQRELIRAVDFASGPDESRSVVLTGPLPVTSANRDPFRFQRDEWHTNLFNVPNGVTIDEWVNMAIRVLSAFAELDPRDRADADAAREIVARLLGRQLCRQVTADETRETARTEMERGSRLDANQWNEAMQREAIAAYYAIKASDDVRCEACPEWPPCDMPVTAGAAPGPPVTSPELKSVSNCCRKPVWQDEGGWLCSGCALHCKLVSVPVS